LTLPQLIFRPVSTARRFPEDEEFVQARTLFPAQKPQSHWFPRQKRLGSRAKGATTL